MAVMQCKDYQLEYEEYGSGDRVLLCCQQSHSRIQNWTISLAETGLFHVYDLTIRGYGKSTHVQEDLGEAWYDVWAEDACGFADALGVDRFFYTGMSHGAGIGWHLCVRHPERLRGFFAIVGGPHSKDGEDTGEARMRTIRAAATQETWKAYCDGIDRNSRPVRKEGMSDEAWQKALAGLTAGGLGFLLAVDGGTLSRGLIVGHLDVLLAWGGRQRPRPLTTHIINASVLC